MTELDLLAKKITNPPSVHERFWNFIEGSLTKEDESLWNEFNKWSSGAVDSVLFPHRFGDWSPTAEFRKFVKVHLMLSPTQLFNQHFLNFATEVQPFIKNLKYMIPNPESCLAENTGKIATPPVVIYCKPNDVEKVKQLALKYFGDLPIENYTIPRYNIRLKGVVYFAEGHGDTKDGLAKIGALDEYFDKETNYATFKIP